VGRIRIGGDDRAEQVGLDHLPLLLVLFGGEGVITATGDESLLGMGVSLSLGKLGCCRVGG
jgi:hypothetical protein